MFFIFDFMYVHQISQKSVDKKKSTLKPGGPLKAVASHNTGDRENINI